MQKQFFLGAALVLLVGKLYAQADLPEVQAKLAVYRNAVPSEKLFVHTDKNAYVAGDLVWMKIYAVDAAENKVVALSKVAYVELLNRESQSVARVKIAMRENGGDGSIQLPLQLPSGNYQLRAYTNAMKNRGAGHFFEKPLTIINTVTSPQPGSEKTLPGTSVRLYPEGGSLVAGLTSRVAFRITDRQGAGVAAKGFLLGSKNDTLAAFGTVKFGMGSFELTPRKGEAYKVSFQLDDGTTVAQVLPTVFDAGYVMRLEDAGSSRLKVTVQTNLATDGGVVYLLAQNHLQVRASQKINTSHGQAVFLLDKNELGEGVSQLTVFGPDKRPVCERLYFLRPALPTALALQPSKKNFGPREKVELSLGAAFTGKENYSLSVYQLDALQQAAAPTISEYIWLTAELSGPVEQPSYYFSDTSETVAHATELLMMTSGWRRFNWSDVFHPVLAQPHPVERSGQIITARVTDRRTNQLAANVQVYLSIPNTPYKLFSATTDSAGLARFRVKSFYGPGELIVQTNSRTDSFYKAEILTPFSDAPLVQPLPSLALSPSQHQALLNNSLNMQAQYVYQPEKFNAFLAPVINDTLPFFGQAMVSYDLDEYVRFTTMEEVLREYVREINVGVKGSGASLRIKLFNSNDRELYTDNILVMVDGIPLFYPNKIFDLNPLKFKRIDVLPVNYVLGDAVFHAVANFTSYNNPYPGLPLDPTAVSVDEEGLQLQRVFYAPEYATAEQRDSRLPDLRTTLFWLPNLSNGKPEFYTSDNKGRFVAVLQGLDANGKAVSATTTFTVE